MKTSRLEAFSDGVLAIASVRVPIKFPQDRQHHLSLRECSKRLAN